MSNRTRRLKQLEATKNTLRDSLDDLKRFVRRSFGNLACELNDVQEAIVEGCGAMQEETILQRLIGSSGGASVAAVFHRIDKLHLALEHAGVRRRRHQQTAVVGGDVATVMSDHALYELPPAPQSPMPDISVATTASQPIETSVEISNGLEGSPLCENLTMASEPQQNMHDDPNTKNSVAVFADEGANDVLPRDASQGAEAQSPSAAVNTRHRTACFVSGNVYCVSPFALQQCCQLRLETLLCFQNEVLSGALQAQRKLVAAKRWVPDAPNPLAASVEGLLSEIQAMKRQLLLESPSVTLSAMPKVQYPLPSINLKTMKQQQLAQLRNSPRRNLTSPGRPSSPSSTSLPLVAYLQGHKNGSQFVEGREAVIAKSNKQKQDAQVAQRRLKKIFDVVPSSNPTVSEASEDVCILRQREQTSSIEIRKILQTVKSEIAEMKTYNKERSITTSSSSKRASNTTTKEQRVVLETLNPSTQERALSRAASRMGQPNLLSFSPNVGEL